METSQPRKLVTYSGPDYYAADFAVKLAQLPKYDTLMVMMEQCHAGGFDASILANSRDRLSCLPKSEWGGRYASLWVRNADW